MSASPQRWIGRPLKRDEDLRFLRGQARFVDDITLPGMVHLVIARSPLAHARVRGIDAEPVRRAPGVLAVVTGDHLAGLAALPIAAPEEARVAPVPHPILAGEKVRYVGEPVAGVLAESRAAAVDAAERLGVKYEPLEAVIDPHEALGGRVLLHEGLGDNILLRWSRSAGDVAGAFAGAVRVVRGKFHIPRLAAAPIEPRGVVAEYDAAGDLLTLWGSAQDPYRPRAQLSRVLRRAEERIRFVVPDVGGAFGSKGALAPEAAVAAWLALQYGRPVKWVEDRRENFAAAYQGRGLDAEVEVAVDAAGLIRAVRARLTADLGAYLYPPTPVPPISTAMLLTGPYAIGAAEVELLGVATNKVPTGPYRGAGRPEAAYIIERMVDLVAQEIRGDPIEVRRANLIPPDRFPYRTPLGFTYDSGQYARALDRACALLDYPRWRKEQRRAREGGRLLGVGVALYVERAGSGVWESAAVAVDPAGRVIVRTGSTAHGQGHGTMFAQIAADALGIDRSAIVVEQGDSAALPRGVGTFGSRSTTLGGSAVLLALEQIRTKATAIAAHLLEAAAGDIEWQDGRLAVRGSPARGLAFHEVAAAAHRPERLPAHLAEGLAASAEFSLPGPVFPFGAYAAVVEVERETGGVEVLRFVAVDDAGRIINPLLAEGQVIGATVQGLGQSLVEEVVYDGAGQLLTGTFADYGLLRAPRIPHVESAFLETPSPFNPLGAKGIGEAGAIGTPAAVASAVMDALLPLGIRHIDLPFTPEKLWRAVREVSAGQVADVAD